MSEHRIDMEPDPRISNMRPAWLADDRSWSDQLQAMDLTDIRWVERHWRDAGGAEPSLDTSWVTYEKASDRFLGVSMESVFWPLATLVVALVVCFGLPMLFTHN